MGLIRTIVIRHLMLAEWAKDPVSRSVSRKYVDSLSLSLGLTLEIHFHQLCGTIFTKGNAAVQEGSSQLPSRGQSGMGIKHRPFQN